jgi:RDD family
MKAETPEWKKEVAEKVKAYGERKKRLTTPPGPIKENESSGPEVTRTSRPPGQQPNRELTPVPVFTKHPDPVVEVYEPADEELPLREPEPKIHPSVEPIQNHSIDIWTEDLEGGEKNQEEDIFTKETPVPPGPYTLRRIAAGLIDNTILVVLWIAFIGGFSMVTHEPIDTLVKTAWNVTLPVFLLIHFVYYLYFFRATRQTPGMVFLSLELRDPGSTVIPIGKVLARWLAMVLLNIFNFLPVLIGRRFLLMDFLSATEMRSFK